MEWEPNERDAWVADAQRWISQIKGVLQCKIELDPDGEVAGVHVVAGFEREPRHIVRDVESLLKARLGIDVYYKKIGVVQVLDSGDPVAGPRAVAAGPGAGAAPRIHQPGGGSPAPEPCTDGPDADPDVLGVSFHPPGFEDQDDWDFEFGQPLEPEAPRPASGTGPGEVAGSRPDPIPAILVAEDGALRILCSGVGVLASESLIRAEVQLQAGGFEARGTREGPNHPDSDVTLVAEAALEAVNRIVKEKVLLNLVEIRTTTIAGQPVFLAAVGLVEGRRSETLFGTCSLRHNRQQAVVFAVLDALNRRLAQYSLRERESAD
ncbi:MAG: hypothetical protein AB7V45_05525 [Candidatus Krumholzibacteriia bacterium]